MNPAVTTPSSAVARRRAMTRRRVRSSTDSGVSLDRGVSATVAAGSIPASLRVHAGSLDDPVDPVPRPVDGQADQVQAGPGHRPDRGPVVLVVAGGEEAGGE